MGTVVNRFPSEKLIWDAAALQFTNKPEANQYLRRDYREGWHVRGVGMIRISLKTPLVLLVLFYAMARPVMQRIGRVDRRLNPQVEEQLVADHPDERLARQSALLDLPASR